MNEKYENFINEFVGLIYFLQQNLEQNYKIFEFSKIPQIKLQNGEFSLIISYHQTFEKPKFLSNILIYIIYFNQYNNKILHMYVKKNINYKRSFIRKKFKTFFKNNNIDFDDSIETISSKFLNFKIGFL